MPKRKFPQEYLSVLGWSRIGLKLGLVSQERKAEPKFKVGDTVKSDYGSIGSVEEIDITHICIFYGVCFNSNDLRWLSESSLQVAVECEHALR